MPKVRSGVSLRWRNGRLNVQVRLKGFPPRSRKLLEKYQSEPRFLKNVALKLAEHILKERKEPEEEYNGL
jgi:hypothetical protein